MTPAASPAGTAPHGWLPRPVVLKLREALVGRASITATEFHGAVTFARTQHMALPDALVALSYVPERAAYDALSLALGVPLVDLESARVSPLAVRLVPERVARRHVALPIAEDNRTLRYATSQPCAADVGEDLSVASGRQAEPVLACPTQLTAAMDRFYPRLTDVERLEEVGHVLAQHEESLDARASGRKRVLIVDDDRMIRMLVRMLLQREGFDVIEAQNGREGIDMALRHRPDLMITDLLMPELDGYGAISALRAEGSCVLMPVIVLSAENGHDVERTVLSLGADDYLIKPFDTDVLVRRVRSVFVRHLRMVN